MNSTNFKTLSLNVRGLHQEKKRRSLFKRLKTENVQICFLQETFSTPEVETRWRHEWGGQIFFVHGTNHARGVMILIQADLDAEIVDVHHDDIGRLLLVNAKIDDGIFKLMNVYSPNSEKSQLHFFRFVHKFMKKYLKSTDNILLGGDFNVILNYTLDRKGGNLVQSHQYKQVISTLQLINSEFELIDIWRTKNPTTKRFTWRRKHPTACSSRLDYWFVSLRLADNVDSTDIVPSYISDHSAVSIDLKSLTSFKPGRGYWKLNNSYLDECDYIRGISEGLLEWVNISLPDARSKWEYIKYKIREFSSVYGKRRIKQRKEHETELYKKLHKKEEQYDATVDEIEAIRLGEEIETIKSQLIEIDNYKMAGLLLRSRARWYEKGEKNTAYFLRLESRNKIKKTVNKLQKTDGSYTSNLKEILGMESDYYNDLYTSRREKKTEEIQAYLNKVETPTLTANEQEACEGQLTAGECFEALNSFENNKSPGNDGITAEFYKKFWPLLSTPLLNCLNEAYRVGELSTSQKQAVITLLDKGKDRTLLKNWRPISLLNLDYKIATKALSNRIKGILSKLIHPNQVGYVQRRNIAENVRSIQDLLTYTKARDIAGYLISIDFQKAFDSLEWSFLECVLNKFNFGPSFKTWIRTLYTDISSCVINNEHTSKYFSLQRGVRQGDPLSPYLFILAGEILSNVVRQNKEIQGIQVDDEEIKILQYADDTCGIFNNSKSAKIFLREVETYGLYAGLKVNKEKTEGLRLGTNHTYVNDSKLFGISWPQNPVRLLGIYFSYDEVKSNENNFETKIQDVKSVINLWKMRDLTLLGRIQIIKTYIISKFMYTCSVIHMPEKYLKEINELIFKFIWKGGRDKVKRSIMVKQLQKGGLKAPDLGLIIEASRINWIKRYLSQSGYAQTWKATVKSLFKQSGVNLDVLLQSNFNTTQLNLTVPKFYIEMLDVWSKVSQTQPMKKDVFLWYNQNIIIGTKPIYFEDFYKIGIKYVTDLFDGSQKVIPFNAWTRKGLPLSNFMNWAGLISASSKCKHLVDVWTSTRSQTVHLIVSDGSTVPLEGISSRFMYNLLIDLKHGYNTNVPNIAKYIDLNNMYQPWENIYGIAHASIDISTRDFQFRFLHDILANNYWLQKWGIRNSAACTFCNNNDENIVHLFWHCAHITTFWKRFNDRYKNLDGMPVTINSVFLGTTNSLVCTLVFIAKRYIWECRMKTCIPFFPQLRNKVYFTQQIEQQIARNNNNMEKWLEKWEPLI